MAPDLRRLLTLAVYAVAIVLGASVLAPDPTGLLFLVPLLVGTALLAHAASTDSLDELGFAIGGMWAAVLLLSAAAGILTVAGAVDAAPLQEAPAASALGTAGVTAVLVAGYLFLRRRADDSVLGE